MNIVVSELETATEFFHRLGFTVEHQGILKGDWISSIVNLEDVKASYVQLALENSDVKIELIKYDSPKSTVSELSSVPNKIGIRHIAFAVKDIETLVSDLKKEGIQFFGDIQTYPETGKKLVYFYGPDGIILELAQYPAN
ncbi:MAG: VOC family protein [Desulfobacterales bacterium]